MPKSKPGWYAVAAGRTPGLYRTWDECEANVRGFSKARYKKFSTKEQAHDYIRTNGSAICGRENDHSARTTYNLPYKRNEREPNRRDYYAVAQGHCPGVYHSWEDAKQQIVGFDQAIHKKCQNEEEALEFCFSNSGKKESKRGKTESVLDTSLELSPGLLKGGFSPTRDANIPPSPDSGSEASDSDSFSSDEDLDLRELDELVKKLTPVKVPDSGVTSGRSIVYTDGSCTGQRGKRSISKRRAGIGVYWPRNPANNLSERLWGLQTNQRAELWAACRALQTALSTGSYWVEIRTDSRYTLKGATEWVRKWRKNGYKDSHGNPVKNDDMFRYLDELTSKVDATWVHVKAHRGEPGNEAADKLAKRGGKMEPRTEESLAQILGAQ